MHSAPASPPNDPDRLHGWKEISACVGKGLRTVQRWEKQYGLPVHRLGEDSDIVFASRREIEEWLRRSSRRRAIEEPARRREGDGPEDVLDVAVAAEIPSVAHGRGVPAAGPTASGSVPHGALPRPDEEAVAPASAPVRRVGHGRHVLGVAAACLTCAVGVGLWWTFAARPSAGPGPAMQPASWRVEDDTLRVFDAAGVQLWDYRFDGTAIEDQYGAPDRAWAGGVTVEDLDGDGPREVLLRVISDDREPSEALRCFNADGSLRWARRLDDRMRFGDDTYSAPWLANHIRVLPNGDGTRSVWAVFVHGLWFPSVLEQIDPHGTVRSRYWSNGYIESLSPATWKGRPVLLVGAANNEHKASSLAVLPREDATATAPAANPKYRCSTCPPREPLAFVVFPPSPLGRLRRDTTAVIKAWATEDDGMTVQVLEPPFGTPLDEGLIYYTLDAEFRPVAVEASIWYEHLHEWWQKAGRLDRPFTAAETKRMVPILKWNGTGYTSLDLAAGR